ncbi:MAG: hypothetical protein JHC88_21255 [Niveispirillum sp.]|nr:hypothetical protein [Niveispirillum sp.]
MSGETRAAARAARSLSRTVSCILSAVASSPASRDPRGAAESLKRALFLDPDHILAHVALAGLAVADGKKSEARRCYRNALNLLSVRAQEETLPDGDGLTVGRLTEIVRVASAEVGA